MGRALSRATQGMTDFTSSSLRQLRSNPTLPYLNGLSEFQMGRALEPSSPTSIGRVTSRPRSRRSTNTSVTNVAIGHFTACGHGSPRVDPAAEISCRIGYFGDREPTNSTTSTGVEMQERLTRHAYLL
jgi:hypothetical protein